MDSNQTHSGEQMDELRQPAEGASPAPSGERAQPEDPALPADLDLEARPPPEEVPDPPPDAAQPATPPSLEGDGDRVIRILIVEDLEPMRRLLARRLRKFGFNELLCVANAEDAQQMLLLADVDAVVCDWKLPGMSGLSLLQWVRAHRRLARLPFVMVTMEASRSRILGALQAGVSDYVVKPVDPELLAQKLRNHIAA